MALIKEGCIMMATGHGPSSIYSIQTNEWKQGPNMPSWGQSCSMVLGGDRVYAFCSQYYPYSCSQIFILTTLETDKEAWVVRRELSIKELFNPGTAIIDSKFFVLGGLGDGDFRGEGHIVSLKEHEYFYVKSVHDRHRCLWKQCTGVATIKKDIFIFGGRSLAGPSCSGATMLNSETLEWTDLPCMSSCRCDMKTAVVDDRFIWIFGGTFARRKYQDDICDFIDIFDAQARKWLPSPSLKLPLMHKIVLACAKGHDIFLAYFVNRECEDDFHLDACVAVLNTDSMKFTVIGSQRKYCLVKDKATAVANL